MRDAPRSFLSKHLSRGVRLKRQLGIALAGLGKLSTQQLAPALQKTEHCYLAGIVSGTPEKATMWKARYRIADESIYSYETMDRMAANPDIDIVYVVTPNALHAEHAIRAARAGKHVFCEKPLEVSVEKCRLMIETCREAGVALGVGYRLHFEPNNLECIRLARERAFGGLRSIEAELETEIRDPTQWRLRRELSGGGPLLDVGIYALQAIRRLTGEEPSLVTATEITADPVSARDIEQSIAWETAFPSGVTARCATAYGARGTSRLTARAAEGWFELDPAFNYSDIRGRRSDGREIRFSAIDQFAAEMDAFALDILEGRPVRAPGDEGLRDVTILTAIYESAASGKPVRLAWD